MGFADTGGDFREGENTKHPRGADGERAEGASATATQIFGTTEYIKPLQGNDPTIPRCCEKMGNNEPVVAKNVQRVRALVG